MLELDIMRLDDAFLLSQLEALAFCEENKDIDLFRPIPYGNIAFIWEKFWKKGDNYRAQNEHNKKRKSHPGLSVSSKSNQLVFGSSKIKNRDRTDSNLFFVKEKDCQILKKDVVFILDTWINGDISMIDQSQTLYAPISEEKQKELRNAGYK